MMEVSKETAPEAAATAPKALIVASRKSTSPVSSGFHRNASEFGGPAAKRENCA